MSILEICKEKMIRGVKKSSAETEDFLRVYLREHESRAITPSVISEGKA